MVQLLLNCSYDEKDDAKRLGAKWSPILKKWCVEDTESNRFKFKRWIPNETPSKNSPISAFNQKAINSPPQSSNSLVNLKKRCNNTIIDINPTKIVALPIQNASKPILKENKSPIHYDNLYNQHDTNTTTGDSTTTPITHLTSEEIQERRVKALAAAESRKKDFKQGGGGDKLKERGIYFSKYHYNNIFKCYSYLFISKEIRGSRETKSG